MTSSATAALIHKRVARLQALVRGRQARQRIVAAVRREYYALRQRLNREAFGGEEPPYEELADLGLFESADEWKGTRHPRPPPPQLLRSSPPPPPVELSPCESAAPVAVGAGRARSREEVLQELARVQRAIQERIQTLKRQEKQQQMQMLQGKEGKFIAAPAPVTAAEADQ